MDWTQTQHPEGQPGGLGAAGELSRVDCGGAEGRGAGVGAGHRASGGRGFSASGPKRGRGPRGRCREPQTRESLSLGFAIQGRLFVFILYDSPSQARSLSHAELRLWPVGTGLS